MIENKLLIDVKETKDVPIVRLVELGRQKGFVTYDDILDILPEAEQDQDHLEAAFTALLAAGIVLKEDEGNPASNKNEAELDGTLDQDETSPLPADPLENIDPMDLVVLYFKDSARHPLLTAREEVVLAKRIENGLKAREELSNGNNLSPHQQQGLHALVDDGWLAIETLITANSALVISVAFKVRRVWGVFSGSDPGRQYRADAGREEI